MARSDEGSSGAGLSVFALILGLLMLVGAGAAYYAGPKLLGLGESATPVTVIAPDKVGDLALSDDPQYNDQITQLKAQLSEDGSPVDSAVAGVYANPADKTKPVLFVAAAGESDDPAGDVQSFLDAKDGGTGLTDIRRDVGGAGEGGESGCGTMKTNNLTMILCIWVDPGSLGIVWFFNQGMDEAVAVFPKFKDASVTA